MANITVLDESTINKIAAGEVIERPASVVKELLENAIDAGATAVTVEIREGGIGLIRVTDNGCGIPREEITLAFLPHATSKIRTAEDLFTVSSLGFRGEALSSIAAVSQAEVITKTSRSLTGVRYQIEGGMEKSLEEVGAPEGTTFIIRNLFFNTPARKKFLKTPVTEGAHIGDMVEKIALSHPEVSIRLIQNNQNKLHTSGNHNLKDLVYTVFGREIAANLISVEAEDPGLTVRGFIGKPVIVRGNRNYENYYINGRFIRSRVVAKAVEEAYRPFLMQHKYPFVLLYLTIDPSQLDVNVHPTKMELRFRDEELIYRSIRDMIREALAQKELIPEVTLNGQKNDSASAGMPMDSSEKYAGISKPLIKKQGLAGGQEMGIPAGKTTDFRKEPLSASNADKPKGSTESKEAKPSREPDKQPEPFEVRRREQLQKGEGLYSRIRDMDPAYIRETEQLDLFEQKLLEPSSRMRHKLIGQLFDTYWLVEYGQNLYIIDQHAAHEKVLFERIMQSIRERRQTVQAVSPPVILTLSPREQVLLKEHMEYFTAMGFEIEPFGGREYAVRGVPANLFSIAKKELLMEMLDELEQEITSREPEAIYEKAASASCKAAVKGGHVLSAMEANQLIDQLLELENPYACPHGRPTIISMSRRELEKKFKRII